MPELPEVETVRAGLCPFVEGHEITTVHVARHDLRRPIPMDLGQRLTRRRVIKLERRGKLLLWRLDSAETMLIHLGMSGRLGISTQKAPQKHDHVTLTMDSGETVTFNDARRFGFFDLCTPEELAADPLLSAMGPEPLGRGFTPQYLLVALSQRSGPIKNVLLDQHVVAGLGNIYVCEALYRAQIAPQQPAKTLQRDECQRLVVAIQDVLSRAIAVGGSTLKDHRKPDGDSGYFQIEFQVYNREGAPCVRHSDRKNHTVTRIVQSGRSTYYCPACQTLHHRA